MAEPIFGFNGNDKDVLLRLVDDWGTGGGEGIAEGRKPDFGFIRARTTASGLAAASIGQAYYMEPIATSPYWQVTTTLYDVYNEGVAIAASKDILLAPVNGRWYVLELCA